jgi:mannose/cellobiose epimerase-like protein (N-acyl-D-glucosamine 2-epimerase family)
MRRTGSYRFTFRAACFPERLPTGQKLGYFTLMSVIPPQAPEFAVEQERAPGPEGHDGFWIDDPGHRGWLARNAIAQFNFFRASMQAPEGFCTLDHAGNPLPTSVQELHTTTRLVHSYALGKLAGVTGCEEIIDRGMAYLASHHRDRDFGGYLWSLDGDRIRDGRKLAYGHVFVLLAASTASLAGHPDAAGLISEITGILDRRFWEADHGRFTDEWNRDWTPFSTYRGMNANMHGVEALLAAFEATGDEIHLDRAGRILDFFMHRMASANDWRLPEHYDDQWRVDRDYQGDPVFRPPGTTPGHSFEMARLLLHHWDLSGRPRDGSSDIARNVVYRALRDGWDRDRGGLVYTLGDDGVPAVLTRFWWPVTEAIGALASLVKLDRRREDELWYRAMWQFSSGHFADHERGGWYPEIDGNGLPSDSQFKGKPDIYHALQAALFPLAPGLSHLAGNLPEIGGILQGSA